MHLFIRYNYTFILFTYLLYLFFYFSFLEIPLPFSQCINYTTNLYQNTDNETRVPVIRESDTLPDYIVVDPHISVSRDSSYPVARIHSDLLTSLVVHP